MQVIHEGMDTTAVLIFRGQRLTNEQQLAFSLSYGQIEQAMGVGLRRPEDHRLGTTFADVSNLAAHARPRQFSIGNRL